MSTETATWTQPYIHLFVPGKPKPAGSKKAFAFRRKNGTIGASVTDDCAKSKDWKALVSLAASEYRPAEIWTGPLALKLVFRAMRPKSHYRTGKNAHVLKDDAPEYPITKPDATKLLRAVEDALTGIIWKDDAQVVVQLCYKVYDDHWGVSVTVSKQDPKAYYNNL